MNATPKKENNSDQSRGTMHGIKHRGLDYTPLFEFLLSKVGCQWDEVYGKAIARLDKKEPIFWMVTLQKKNKKITFAQVSPVISVAYMLTCKAFYKLLTQC